MVTVITVVTAITAITVDTVITVVMVVSIVTVVTVVTVVSANHGTQPPRPAGIDPTPLHPTSALTVGFQPVPILPALRNTQQQAEMV